MDESTKAYQLTGVTIPGGWLLKERYVKEKKDDRRHFSVQYFAEKDGKEYFVKVIDIEKALKGRDLTDTIDMVPGGVVLNIEKGQWHSLKCLESGTALFEAKDVLDLLGIKRG